VSREEPDRIWVWRDAFQNMRVSKSRPAGEVSVEYVRVDRLPNSQVAAHNDPPPRGRREIEVRPKKAALVRVKSAPKRKISTT